MIKLSPWDRLTAAPFCVSFATILNFDYRGQLYDVTVPAGMIDRATELLGGGVSEADFLELNLMFDVRVSAWSVFINDSVAIHPDIAGGSQ